MSRTIHKKAYVAVSGGVDSSVAAAFLKDAGYDVTGVFIEVWKPPFMDCPMEQERHDAMRVCAHLGIGFQTLDLAEAYKRSVIDYLVREYRKGRTPNPDVMCNRHIKFGAFYEWARERGADVVATGHYARLTGRNDAPCELHRSVDEAKDQTYFLWTLRQEQLEHLRFPVGHLQKSQVRAEARLRGLPTAQKKESQGLCFLGKLDMREFLEHFIESRPGAVLSTEGEVIGEHAGAYFYTYGQRRGFHTRKQSAHEDPYYVVDKNVNANTIMVSQRPLQDAVADTGRALTLERPNWIGEPPMPKGNYQARLRHRQPLFSVVLDQHFDRHSTVSLAQAQSGVAPGQSLVLYDGTRCLGGGTLA